MAVKKFKPYTKTMRYKTVADFSELTKKAPERSLLKPLRKSGGRNNQGHLTSRHIGGGHKQKMRIVDFLRNKNGVPAKVTALEYDPNRSARLALLVYNDGEKRYIIAPNGLKVGATLVSGSNVPVEVGNAMPLIEIPAGTDVHGIELRRGKGAQVARSAGSFCTVMAKENGMVQLKMPSGEIRLFRGECFAVIGQVGNIEHENIVVGKAGRTRWKGIRPHVRGMAMNPVDHPMGGGEGRSKSGGGYQHPESPWGLAAKGKKTRNTKKVSSKYIIKRYSDK
ncbi:MAG: 50S ribosomal protein L2 [Fibrobacteres bacterium]|nr:50S ribosomal protein L2 [Fibrobacterota bacterium]